MLRYENIKHEQEEKNMKNGSNLKISELCFSLIHIFVIFVASN